jgi:plasmid maintenance system antidote protein VapI
MDWKAHINSLLSFGWTVDALAGRMDVSPQAIREILAGRTKAPRADAAIKLAAIPLAPPPAEAA